MAQGIIGGATTDAVSASVSGMRFRTARWIVDVAGTAKVSTEYTRDGVNWRPAPYSERVDVVSANPAVAAWQDATPVVGSYDAPLPADALAFRVRCSTTGTTASVRVTGGQPYAEDMPATAVLYDVTSGVNGTLDTGILETGGWDRLDMYLVAPAGGDIVVTPVDDAGNKLAALLDTGGSVNLYATFGPAVAAPSLQGLAPGGLALTKRMEVTATAVALLTSRIRIEARRGV